MKEYTVLMGIADYITVILFACTSVTMIKAMYGRCKSGEFAAMASGFIFMFFAGFAKATYKTLYGAGICDFEILSSSQMMLTGIGGFILGCALITIGRKTNNKLTLLATAPPLIKSNMLFIIFATLGSVAIFIGFTSIALRVKSKKAIIFAGVYLFLSLALGGIGSKADFSSSGVNWAAQCVQYVSNTGLLLSALIIAKKIKENESAIEVF